MAVYVPITQNAWTFAHFAVQATTREPEALTRMIRGAVGRVDPNLPVTHVRTLDDIAWEATSRPRFRAHLVGASAVLAIVLTNTARITSVGVAMGLATAALLSRSLQDCCSA